MRSLLLLTRLQFRYALFALGGILLCVTPAHAQYTIISATISPSSVTTSSAQQANVNITANIRRSPGAEADNVSVQCNSTYASASFIIPPFQTSGSGHLTTRNVGSPVGATVICTVAGTTASASVTLLPNTPTITFASTSLPSGGTTNVSISMAAPIPLDISSYPVVIDVVPSSVGNGGPYSVAGGSTSGGGTFTAAGASAPISASVTPWLNDGPGGGFPRGNSVGITVFPNSPPPPPNPDPGPCPTKGCEGLAGQPINVTNGNTWVQKQDYSIPGLAGGITLTRTWNSIWSNLTPLNQVGMFGDSWISTYEERLDSRTSILKYWRGDGGLWNFQYNGTTGTYQLIFPPDERASLTFNSVALLYTMTFPGGTQRIFNNAGYLTAVIDRNANRTNVTYDASNRITQVTSPGGQSLTFNYVGPSTLVQSIQDPVGVFATYSYGPNSRLSQVTFADGTFITYNYDASLLLTSVTDTNAKIIEAHTYDASRRGVTSQKADGAELVTVSYPAAGQARLTDSLNHLTTFGYQVIGGRSFVTSVAGPGCVSCGASNSANYGYNGMGDRTASTDANGKTTSYTYDAMGNILTRSNVVGGVTLTWTYTYNNFNEVLTARDPLGNTTTNTYDTNGNLLSVTTPAPDATTPASTTNFTYYPNGLLNTIQDPLLNTTSLTYTPAGLLETITDPQLNVTTYGYDLRANRTTILDANNKTTTFTYDLLNRLTRITYPDTSTTQFGYDTRGRRTTVTDANTRVTTYLYDDADRLTSVKDPANQTTAYGYDTESNLTSITDANLRSTGFHYNSNRWLDRTDFPASGMNEYYTYDLVGNLTSKRDRKSQFISYAYDELNRLTRKTYADNTRVDYTYDNANRLTQVVDPTGTYQFAFDNMGRLTTATTNYAFLTGRSLITRYAYDAASNRTGFTDPENGATSYMYDALNRLQTLTPPSAYVVGSFGFGYDALSRRTSLTRPNNVTTNYAYDDLSRLLSVLHQVGLTTIDGAAYTVDPVGNRTAKTDQRTSVSSTYGYDLIYQLTGVTQGVTSTEAYTYDPVGNRLSSLGVSPYSYDISNRLTSKPGVTYTYDNNGNTLTKTEPAGVTSYSWDFENRLASVTLPGTGGTVTFKYDPAGRRIQKLLTQGSTSTTTNYVYDGKGPNLIEEVDGLGNVTARYVYGKRIDEPLAALRAGVTSYYETDGMGSVSSLSNASGANAQTYTYDSFGNLTASTGTITNPFRYTGREFDSETRLYFYRARYYDPQVGRFISEDPLRFAAGDVNFYSYVSGNPINYRDPSGQTSIPIIFWGWWCGPNWTGGRFEEYNPKHAKLYIEPIDAADKVCKEHDICYYQCRDSVPCDADARSKCMTICDARLILNMPSTGVGPILAAGIDFFNDHPDAGANAPNCPGCKFPPPPKPCVGFSCLGNR